MPAQHVLRLTATAVARVCIALDNCGVELVSDLVMAYWLLHTGIAASVVLLCKVGSSPWQRRGCCADMTARALQTSPTFVSDANEKVRRARGTPWSVSSPACL